MKILNFILVAGLIVLAGPATLQAQNKESIQEGSAHSLQAAGQAREVFQTHKDKAGGELIAAAVELLDKAQAFHQAAQAAKDPKKDSRDEYWELVRHRRNLDAALSVSSLRKNKELKAALSALDQSLAELKPYF